MQNKCKKIVDEQFFKIRVLISSSIDTDDR